MEALYTDSDKYGYQAKFPVVEAYHASMKDLVRRKLNEAGVSWDRFVFGLAEEAIGEAEIAELAAILPELGYKFEWSAAISARERPELYEPISGVGEDDAADFSFDHPEAPKAPPDEKGRALCGHGDNVAVHEKNTVGIARYIRSPDQVFALLNDGVPDDMIAVIDDSGGTLTAPIIEEFKGVICAGGSTRSHLGILTREYGVPCVMNAKISGLKNGDRVEIEATGKPKTAEDYQAGREVTSRIWRSNDAS